MNELKGSSQNAKAEDSLIEAIFEIRVIVIILV